MKAPRPKVLMIAFACNPAGGGEHWLGWGWAEQASKSYDVTLLAWDRFEAAIQTKAKETGVRAVCVGVPAWVNRIGDRNTLGRWFRQLIWHRKVLRIANQLHSENKFELVHQTTFHTFRIPFLAAEWNIPKIWGPIAGGESCPPGFGPWLGKLRTSEAMRGTINRLALAQPGVQRSLRAADALFVSNHTTLDFLPEHCRSRCMVVPPNAIRGELAPPPERASAPNAPLKLLFVGNCVATRAMPLVFDALKQMPKSIWNLKIVGSGAALADWKYDAARAGLNGNVTFTGSVPYAEVARHYAEADAFVFPALRDSGGSGVLEAMSSGLPVVCCDWGGPAEMVDEQSAIKIPVKRPDETIAGFARAFERLQAQPAWRLALGRAAFERARNVFSWERKRELLEKTYGRFLGLTR
ncbi:MAG TPA: glycosyltransferase [Verrucomicrobiae bacterium]|nr:glycosyltransferase [Verrucomicrobiae bacterium]